MFYQNIKDAINHYVTTEKVRTLISGYRFNTILNDIYDTITNVSWISQTITNGVTDKSPSEDAVFDALALKVDISLLPLKYKALLKQSTPIASTSHYFMISFFSLRNLITSTISPVKNVESPAFVIRILENI